MLLWEFSHLSEATVWATDVVVAVLVLLVPFLVVFRVMVFRVLRKPFEVFLV